MRPVRSLARRARPAPLIVLLALAACALPDVRPFADPTARVGDGLLECGEVTVDRLRDGEPLPREEPAEEGRLRDAWELEQLWRTRLFAADALARYADTLAELADAGKRGARRGRGSAPRSRTLRAASPVPSARSPRPSSTWARSSWRSRCA